MKAIGIIGSRSLCKGCTIFVYFFLCTERIDESYMKGLNTTSNCR